MVSRGRWLGEVAGEPRMRQHPVLLADHQVRRRAALGQLQQARQQQRLHQQLVVGRAVRDVVDDVEQVVVAQARRRRADRQVRQLTGERQLQHPRAERPGRSATPAGPPRTSPRSRTSPACNRCQPPAGAIPVSVRARPRRSSSNATQPPSEFPTMCAVSQPSASSRRSMSSASSAVVQEEPALDTAVVAGHGRGEDFVAAGLSNQRRDLFPHVLRHHERMQQQHRFAGTQVYRCALGHAADTKGDTAGIARRSVRVGSVIVSTINVNGIRAGGRWRDSRPHHAGRNVGREFAVERSRVRRGVTSSALHQTGEAGTG